MSKFSADELLTELYLAIDAKHGMNTLQRRQNALSPRIEMALENARVAIGLPQSPVARDALAVAKDVYSE